MRYIIITFAIFFSSKKYIFLSWKEINLIILIWLKPIKGIFILYSKMYQYSVPDAVWLKLYPGLLLWRGRGVFNQTAPELAQKINILTVNTVSDLVTLIKIL